MKKYWMTGVVGSLMLFLYYFLHFPIYVYHDRNDYLLPFPEDPFPLDPTYVDNILLSVRHLLPKANYPFPYPPTGPADSEGIYSTTYCKGHPRCNITVFPIDKSSKVYKVTHKFASSPAIPDMPPVHLHIPFYDGYTSPEVLIFPGSACDPIGPTYDCLLQCPVQCRASTEHKEEADATVKLFLGGQAERAHPHQKVVAFHPEYGHGGSREVHLANDLVMDAHQTAHVFLLAHDNKYFGSDELEFDRPGFPAGSLDGLCCPPSEAQIPGALVGWVQGQCWGYRPEWVAELQQYLHVASYGSCMNNRAQPPSEDPRYSLKKNVLSQHKFCLALENDVEVDDWVTEKIFHSLSAGCVPVYYGPENVNLFLPCKDCMIHVRDFGSVKELAEYLIYLDNNPEVYRRYLEYKGRPMLLKPMLQASKRFSWCALCYEVSMMKKTGVPLPKIEWSKDNKWVIIDQENGTLPSPE